jgi:hypothetical protein
MFLDEGSASLMGFWLLEFGFGCFSRVRAFVVESYEDGKNVACFGGWFEIREDAKGLDTLECL